MNYVRNPITRPGQTLPGWSIRNDVGGFADLMDEPSEAAREARTALWLERIMWGCGGACVGFFTLWACITF